MVDPNAPAFPIKGRPEKRFEDGRLDMPHIPHMMGLTKRELFAAMTMQGIIAHLGITGTESDKAIVAVSCADALIEELNKNG